MNFLHYELQLNAGDVVEVTLDKQANVQLLDNLNFSKYKNRQQYRYHGGLQKKSPAHIEAPHAGQWNLVIDLGGRRGTVNASVRVI